MFEKLRKILKIEEPEPEIKVPVKKLATIVEDSPLEPFPTYETNL